MKNYRQLFVSGVLIMILWGCTTGPDVRFSEPQPLDKRDLKAFPRVFRGTYVSLSDSSTLTISANTIIQEWNGLARIAKSKMREDLDTTYTRDTKVTLGKNWTMSVKLEGDSVSVATYGVDTLFALSDKQLLRTFKGYLFLNLKNKENTWKVQILKVGRNLLKFDDLVNVKQIDTLREVTNVIMAMDTATHRVSHYYLNPKRKEVKEMLKRGNNTSQFRKL